MSGVELWIFNAFRIAGGACLLAMAFIFAMAIGCKVVDAIVRMCRVHWAVASFIWYRKEFYKWAAENDVDLREKKGKEGEA